MIKKNEQLVISSESDRDSVVGEISEDNKIYIFKKMPTSIYSSNSFDLVVTSKDMKPMTIYENVSMNNQCLYSEVLKELKALIPNRIEDIDNILNLFLSSSKKNNIATI